MRGNIVAILGIVVLVAVWIVHADNALAAVALVGGFGMVAGGLVANEIGREVRK